jgi:hypothetical protein
MGGARRADEGGRVTLLGRLRRAVSGRDDVRIEERLKEISDRLAKVEESIAHLKPNIRMLPAIVRRLYLDDVDLPPPYDLFSQRFPYVSQNEEDGLLLALFKRIGTTGRRSVEIGCGLNGGNSGFLVKECGWTGLMVDANRAKIETVRARLAGHAATIVKHRVTRDDIDSLLATYGFTGEIDLLSIDIDGMDYWVWEATTACSPRVVALEYNWLFGPERSVTVPYDAAFEVGAVGTRSYRGASLAAFVHLSRRKGYRLIATERVNAFFLRNDVAPDIAEIDARRGYRPPNNVTRAQDAFQKIEKQGLPLVTIPESGVVEA